jgi:hypothetical protein
VWDPMDTENLRESQLLGNNFIPFTRKADSVCSVTLLMSQLCVLCLQGPGIAVDRQLYV